LSNLLTAYEKNVQIIPMKNKIIWITGASSGIGLGLFHYLNERGIKTIISSRDVKKLEEIKATSKQPELVGVVKVDLEKFDSLDAATAEAIGIFGKIDVLINNGGISQRDLVVNTSFDVDQRLINVNYLGTVKLTKALLPHYIKNKSGAFITVTSLVGKFGTPYRSSYSASKHALHGFFDSLRAEVSDLGIKVMIVCPGFIKTNISINALTGSGKQLGEMDDAQANGMSVDIFAKKLFSAFESGKEEVCIGGKETFGVLLKRFVPTYFSKMIAKAKVR
jgi:dehydrogenase/reductase SDR family protein 7B